MKNVSFQILLLACLSIFFMASCEDDPEPLVTPKRTVLVYMAADNNLAHFAYDDVDEIKEGMAATNGELRLLVYMDTGTSARLMELKKENGNVVEDVVREYGDRNSAGTEETREVFNDVFSNPTYAAESYGLIYWSHADGWAPYGKRRQTRWVGQDTGDGDNRMNISDFVSVLEGAPHFNFIMFDACFMSSVEVAYELRHYTDYYIGSPTENPGPGAPYDLITPLMTNDNAATDMASAYFKHYEAKYNGGIGISNDNWTGGTSICVIRTSALEQLATLTSQSLPQKNIDGSSLREEVFNYDQRSSDSSSFIGYYDWVDMMRLLLSEADFDAWKQIFDASIVYHTTPMNYSAVTHMFSMEGTHGVTHYIPVGEEKYALAYRSTSWYQDAGLAKLGW